MYFELSLLGAGAVGEKKSWPYRISQKEELIALAGDMSRFDPRLFDILVEFLHAHWRDFNPLIVRTFMKNMDTPQALLAVLRFALVPHTDPETAYLYDYLRKGWSPAPCQLFFKNLYQPGSQNMTRAAAESLQEFREWGFLARERPILHGKTRKSLGHWGPGERERILNRLLAQKKEITLSRYLEALERSISRQQALIDLKNHPGLKMKGKGRGSVWLAA